MRMTTKVAELRRLQTRADAIRKELRISRAGEVTFFAPCNGIGDDVLVVETDGLGGAKAMVVEGNYPVDYVTKLERSFPTEREAEAAAESIAFNGDLPADILGEPTYRLI